jgi:iron complex transport system permease protein
MPIAAVGGALAATALLSIAAVRTQSIVTLILIGVGISSFAGALMALLMNFAPNPFSLSDMVNWMLGSVANRSFEDIALAAPFLAFGVLILLSSARGLLALSLGEEGAAAVGLDLARARIAIVVGAGLATGAAVSLAGAIGFVGLVAPHLMRPLVGHDPSRTLIPAALLAGVLLLIADILVRVLPADTELKLGVVAALIGAPAFIWIAARRRTGDG